MKLLHKEVNRKKKTKRKEKLRFAKLPMMSLFVFVESQRQVRRNLQSIKLGGIRRGRQRNSGTASLKIANTYLRKEKVSRNMFRTYTSKSSTIFVNTAQMGQMRSMLLTITCQRITELVFQYHAGSWGAQKCLHLLSPGTGMRSIAMRGRFFPAPMKGVRNPLKERKT